MMAYDVGQVLYAVLRKEPRVYPIQVVEVITKTSMTGKSVDYVVRVGADPNKTMVISDVDGELFDSAEKAKTVLIERASAQITRMIDEASKKSNEWYAGSFESPNMITDLKKKPPNPTRNNPVHELAAELS